MDKFQMLDGIIVLVDKLADSRGVERCSIIVDIINRLGRIIHHIQLGAADHGYLILHKIMMEIAIGISGTVGSDQQISAVKIGSIGRQELDLHREVG